MKEFIWLGRGGQGAFTAAKLLGAAFALKGNANFSLAFPSFGPERRGAPVRAFTKLDVKPILDRSETEKADYIIILDQTLYSEDLKNKLKDDGRIFVNSKVLNDEKVISFDAEKIAQMFKLPTVNTVMLGVTAALSEVVSAGELGDAIDGYMPQKIREKNNAAILEAIGEVTK